MNYKQHGNILVEALPYIQKYYGKTIVVKYGGNAMVDESITKSVLEDIILMKCIGINPIIVHGGGPDINHTLTKMNYDIKFINGLRYTDENTINIVQMVLAGKVNKDLVKAIHKYGGKAIGLSGIDGGLIKANKSITEVDLGFVGDITSINTDLITSVIKSGFIPVISSVAIGESDFNTYNINADICASKIASHLKAEKLIILTDILGVCANIEDNNTLISTLRLHEIPKLMASNTISGGMIPKINCCVEAIRNGVNKTHIIDGRVSHSILLELLSENGIGTEIF